MALFEFKNRYNNAVMALIEAHSLREAVALCAARNVPLNKVNLSGADLEGAVMCGLDLRDADLSQSKLRWADLRGARLDGALLVCADLRESLLRLEEIKKALTEGAILRGAFLE